MLLKFFKSVVSLSNFCLLKSMSLAIFRKYAVCFFLISLSSCISKKKLRVKCTSGSYFLSFDSIEFSYSFSTKGIKSKIVPCFRFSLAWSTSSIIFLSILDFRLFNLKDSVKIWILPIICISFDSDSSISEWQISAFLITDECISLKTFIDPNIPWYILVFLLYIPNFLVNMT